MGTGGIRSMFIGALLVHAVIAARRNDLRLSARPTQQALLQIADAVGAAKFEEMTLDSIADSSKTVPKLAENGGDDVEYLTYQGVMGRPGVDFPVYPSIPRTTFNCKEVPTGYYADLETDCQTFHICDGGRKISFLCPNGTIFRQSHLICDWWFKVDCSSSPDLYEESAEHLAEDQRKRERANKQATGPKNFDTIVTTQRRPQNNFLSGIQSSGEYKAEASFTSVAQAPGKQQLDQKNQSREQKRNSKRVQKNESSVNSNQQSSFEFSKEDDTSHLDIQRQNNENAFKFSTTRRSMIDYTDSSTYRSAVDSKESKESQVVAESASFVNNRGRNNFVQYTTIIDSRNRPSTTVNAPRTTRPTYTTSYVPGTKNYVEVTRSVAQSVTTNKPPVTSVNTYSSSFRTTDSTPKSTNKEDVSVSFVQYNQFPTTTVPHNHYKVTTNHTIPRRGKGFAYHEAPLLNKTSVRNTYPLDDKSKSANFYAPTVPTVTPKVITSDNTANKYSTSDWYSSVKVEDDTTVPTTPSPTYSSTYVTEPIVSEHAKEMIKTLEELEIGSAEPTIETEKFLGARPGLVVPPSAGPNTLHSLAIYFATAVDSLVTTPAPTLPTEQVEFEQATEQQKATESDKEALMSFLSRNTLNKYTDLFKNSTEEKTERIGSLEEDVSNDLDLSQSSRPLASSPQIRELAQVFTHALSAYLQDPETFRRVLSEIRPTEPTSYSEPPTTTPASIYVPDTTPNEYASVTKEDDEVLDFSDVSKSSPKMPPLRSTLIPYENPTMRYKEETIIDNYSVKTTKSYPQEHNGKNRTPASQLITEGSFEDLDSDRDGKDLKTTSNPLAEEVNGGLTLKNDKVPQSFVTETRNNSYDYGSSYFPVPTGGSEGTPLPKYGGFQNNSSEVSSSPYGAGVKPTNSEPLGPTYSPEKQSIPLYWGDTLSTRDSSTLINPSEPSVELLPPGGNQQSNKLDSVEMSVLNSFVPEDLNDLATINSTDPTTIATKGWVTEKYEIYNTDSDIYKNDQSVINDNDEQLQRAHSQSFIASKNQIGRRGKQSKNKNPTLKDEKIEPEPITDTVRTSDGSIISLPTLKDIISNPSQASLVSDVTSNSGETTPVSTIFDETTTPAIPTTTQIYTRSSQKSQRAQSTPQPNIWSTSAALGHIWQTTVFLDPMTINDGLTGDVSSETIQPSANTYYTRPNTRTTYDSTDYTQHTGGSQQYSTATTPISTIKYEEYTTTTPEDLTTAGTTEASLPSHEILLDKNEYFNQFKKENQPLVVTEKVERGGKAIDVYSTNLPLNKLETVDVDKTMMAKAKEMFGGLNASSADTLMNVMKQADKNTNVRRLILLLIQTCDDDHNKTLEASRRALLDALIRLPVQEKPDQNPLSLEITGQYEDIQTTPIENNSFEQIRRSDEIIDTDDTKRPELYQLSDRKGKSFEEITTPLAPQTTTTEKVETTTEILTTTAPTTTTPTTTTPTTTTSTTTTTTTTTTQRPTTSVTPTPVVTIKMMRRGNRKYLVKSTKTAVNRQQSFGGDFQSNTDKGSVVSLEEENVPSDTRALELLRSLYSLAARWG